VTEAPSARRGRPRRPEVAAAIMAAAVELVVEGGFAGVTVESVAARAGVGKATVYRRWPNRRQLLLDVAAAAGASVPAPATGAIRTDLLRLVSAFRDQLQSSAGAMTADLMAEARRDPDMRAALDAFLASRRRPWSASLAAAAERGELDPGVDHELVIDAVAGAVLYRSSLSGRPVGDEVLAALVDQALGGVGRAPDP
jgi:AcrR family transcriptional regulator